MTKSVQMVLVCEDRQHHVFVRRFLKTMGWRVDRLRIESSPAGRGAGDQFVRSRYLKELKGLRDGVALLTMLDGDAVGLAGRLRQLKHAGDDARLAAPDRNSVFAVVPTWNIETWLAYLDGDTVDEANPNYPRLERERQCQGHVDALAAMCRARKLREPAPTALVAACEEYHRLASNH